LIVEDYPSSDSLDDWDDPPWADPALRAAYEAALGRLILAHNEVDLRLTQLIERCLKRLGDPAALLKLSKGMFFQRVQNIELLRAFPIELELSAVNVPKLIELNEHRNVVAHGHFEQNPYDGEYVLIARKKQITEYPTERLNEITAQLQEQARFLSARVDFYDPPVLPPDAIPL
jgi:hypothetical protein